MRRQTSFEAFSAAAAAGGVIPVVRELPADTLTPITAFRALARPPFAFLLESLVGGERWARYTFLGTEPREAWRYREGTVGRWTPGSGWQPDVKARDPLEHLAAQLRSLKPAPVTGLPRFWGGAVGFLSYDAVRAIERLPGGPADDLGFPDAMFLVADTVGIIDNAFGRVRVVSSAEVPAGADRRALKRGYEGALERSAAFADRLRTPPAVAPITLEGDASLTPESPYPRAAFERDVGRIKEFIRDGEAFQVVLSRRQEVPCAADPFDVYRSLRTLNPAPYLYYLALDDLHVVGSSPEVLVRVEDGEVTARPIAGTRPRGTTSEEDAALAADLMADQKERAEHAMLVDLGRNDVGRVAEYGTVRVTVDKELERYSHVQHIVSEVRGRLRAGLDAADVLRACFPAGTVSGAPKVRAMQILDGLEPTRRGPYAGAVGYLGWGAATLDTAIAIRTAVLRGGRAYVQAGAGIVADSHPEQEFEETESKASAVLRALAVATNH